MSYVDEVIDLVVKKNPAEPEFHQAVKEVLVSLRVVFVAFVVFFSGFLLYVVVTWMFKKWFAQPMFK